MTNNNFSNFMVNGQITEVKDGIITIKGTVRFPDANNTYAELRTIQFVLTPKTVVKKSQLVIPKDAKPGVQFTPEVIEVDGDKNELVTNTTIPKLYAKENLFKVDKATLTDIKYAIVKH